jgi:hypothetical protein
MKAILYLLLITICLQNANAEPYKKGYYYTHDGVKTEGLIKYNRATFSAFGSKKSSISFKENDDAKPVKFTADDIPAFVIDNDSFTIVYNIKINSVSGEYAKDFAKVVAIGKMNLFVHMSASSSGTWDYENDVIVLSKDGKSFLGIWNPKKQREEIAELFSDNPGIKARILNKEFDKNIPGLVTEYNRD